MSIQLNDSNSSIHQSSKKFSNAHQQLQTVVGMVEANNHIVQEMKDTVYQEDHSIQAIRQSMDELQALSEELTSLCNTVD
jgi:hypothetical protein